MMTDESKVIIESSKAAREMAKTTGKAIDLVERFGGFIRAYPVVTHTHYI